MAKDTNETISLEHFYFSGESLDDRNCFPRKIILLQIKSTKLENDDKEWL